MAVYKQPLWAAQNVAIVITMTLNLGPVCADANYSIVFEEKTECLRLHRIYNYYYYIRLCKL